MSTVRLSITTNVMLTVSILAERISESVRDTIARWTGKTPACTQAAQIPTVEAARIKDAEGMWQNVGGSMYEALLALPGMYASLSPLYAQYLGAVGGEPMDALWVCMNDPEKAQAAIDAFTASLHTIADVVMAEASVVPAPHVRKRL